MVLITGVSAGSLAEKHGIRAGDTLVSVNNNGIADVLDYRFYLTERSVALRLLRDGEPYTVLIRKGEYEDIGLEFETPLMDKKHTCKNGCIFCFIDQNPPGMRESIYFKDDDSRLSFLHGNYITLTNMTDADIDRIIKMRFSPVNISVHTTNPELRVKMMKNKNAGAVLRYLGRLRDAGISMCGQIVLCHGINDGEELQRTMRDLSGYFPELGSVSVVPAGLTAYRQKLYPLTDFSEKEAGEVIDAVESFGEAFRKEHGSRLFFAADEFYLKAKRPLPGEESYEGYPQIENGVGMLRSFDSEFAMAAEDVADGLLTCDTPRRVSVVTGVAAYDTIRKSAETLERKLPGLTVSVYEIRNRFFGESITVAGLLTGRDIAEQLEGRDLGDLLLVPECAVRREGDLFLCGMTLGELSERLGVRVEKSPSDGYGFAEKVLGTKNTEL